VKQHERVAAEEVIARMRRLLGRLSARRRVRHAVVAVESVDGAWAWSDAAGEATPEGRPMRAASPWLLASITKLYVATVLLRLHERGVVDLDAPVSAYLPPKLAPRLHVLDGVDHTERVTPRICSATSLGPPTRSRSVPGAAAACSRRFSRTATEPGLRRTPS
jgi:CubicO group peptidase (beta-lactamase class C family)